MRIIAVLLLLATVANCDYVDDIWDRRPCNKTSDCVPGRTCRPSGDFVSRMMCLKPDEYPEIVEKSRKPPFIPMRPLLALLLLATAANCEYWTCNMDADCPAGRACRKTYHNFPLKSCLRPREYFVEEHRNSKEIRCVTDQECPPDDEKTQNWTSLTLAVLLLTIVNLGIIITIRWLLDTTDENHHPRVDEALREKLTVFLGVFSMTFCFGCWCCCCCGGVLCRYFFCWPVYCYQYAGNCMHDIVASHQFTKEERVQRVRDQDKALEEQIRQAHGFPAK
ncbi:unnamed protein product, partial [Mesorhabditis spiculigera]